MNPSHGASERDAHKLGLVIVTREDDCESKTVLGVQEETIEPILDVGFGDAHGAKLGISMTYLEEKTIQSETKLHGFRSRMRDGRVVDRWPAPLPGVVAKKARLPVALILDGSRGEHELR